MRTRRSVPPAGGAISDATRLARNVPVACTSSFSVPRTTRWTAGSARQPVPVPRHDGRGHRREHDGASHPRQARQLHGHPRISVRLDRAGRGFGRRQPVSGFDA